MSITVKGLNFSLNDLSFFFGPAPNQNTHAMAIELFKIQGNSNNTSDFDIKKIS